MNFKIIIPEKVSLNAIYSGIHWAKRKNLADMYHMAVKIALIQTKPPKIEEFPLDLVYSFTFKKNALDSSNCAFMGKMIEDGLVSNGLIPDDSPKYIRSSKYISQKGDTDEVSIFY